MSTVEDVPAGVHDAAKLQEQFTADVHRCFGELAKRGMPPNEACALSLKVAAGVVPLPQSLDDLHKYIAGAKETGQYDELEVKVRNFFSSPDAIFASFWPTNSSSSSRNGADTEHQQQKQQQKQQQQQQAKEPPDKQAGTQDGAPTTTTTTSSSSSSSSSTGDPPAEPMDCSDPNNQTQAPSPNDSSSNPTSSSSSSSNKSSRKVDMEAIHSLYCALQSTKHPAILSAVSSGCGKLVDHMCGTTGRGQLNPGFIRQAAVLLLNPQLEDTDQFPLVERLAVVLVGAPEEQKGEVLDMMKGWEERDMRMVVVTLQQYITLTLYSQRTITAGVAAGSRLLGLVAAANDASGVLQYSHFYNDAVNNEDFNVKEDFRRWKMQMLSMQSGRLPQGSSSFSFCETPFVYEPASKARIMQLENSMEQYQEFQGSVMQAFLGNHFSPYMVLKVRRGAHLLQDTLIQINRAKENGDLKKPLKVKFLGEEGVDEGGVQKEFFQLLVRQCFNAEFGMFTYDEDTRLNWFMPSNMDLELEFELIGILIGLAIYNNHILEFQFPLVLYRKLLGHQLGMRDLEELQPDIAVSMKKLMDMSPQEVEGLGLVFQVECAMLGAMESVELLPGGADIPVTSANRGQYVEQYMHHLLTASIARQFDAFKRGFQRMCSGAALQMFRPEELEALVCGGRVLDMEALQANVRYDDGYTEHSRIISWFWEIVHAFNEHQKKRLLFFITGSDRVPIKGLAHLSPQFVISRNGPHSERLPTAHTCFNHLLLPDYKDKESLQQRLLLAIENAEGFGLM